MPPDLVLAIDLGSSWCKAAYLDRHGAMVAEGRTRSRDIAGDGERGLERFWQTVAEAVAGQKQKTSADSRAVTTQSVEIQSPRLAAESELRAGVPVNPERIDDLDMAVQECSAFIESLLAAAGE